MKKYEYGFSTYNIEEVDALPMIGDEFRDGVVLTKWIETGIIDSSIYPADNGCFERRLIAIGEAEDEDGEVTRVAFSTPCYDMMLASEYVPKVGDMFTGMKVVEVDDEYDGLALIFMANQDGALERLVAASIIED